MANLHGFFDTDSGSVNVRVITVIIVYAYYIYVHKLDPYMEKVSYQYSVGLNIVPSGPVTVSYSWQHNYTFSHCISRLLDKSVKVEFCIAFRGNFCNTS